MSSHTMMRRAAMPSGAPRRGAVRVRASQAVATTPLVRVVAHGSFSVKGTVRKMNEDRFDVQVTAPGDALDPYTWGGVFDGHGGYAVADWLANRLFAQVEKMWDGKQPEESVEKAYLQADKRLLSSSSGFMGMGERGVGGSKCGATAATILIYKDVDGSSKLVSANVGDARTVLVRDGQPLQLTVDHVPDSEEERKRIEAFNPNPKMPLVRYIGGTWRVGGLLALSRAFGDAYLKSTLQFEGLAQGNADSQYSSGFGLVAEPHVVLETLTSGDSWLVVSSDGLYAEEERGGGGGLDNQSVAELCLAAGPNVSCDALAKTLAEAAIKLGSTDDVTVLVFKLSS